jgi:hypothetical protein
MIGFGTDGGWRAFLITWAPSRSSERLNALSDVSSNTVAVNLDVVWLHLLMNAKYTLELRRMGRPRVRLQRGLRHSAMKCPDCKLILGSKI